MICLTGFLTTVLLFSQMNNMKTSDAIREIGKHSAFLPNEIGVTLPIISRESDHIIFRRLIYLNRVTPSSNTITQPQYIAAVDLSTGKFLYLRALTAEDHPKDLPPSPWSHNKHRFDTPQQMLEEYESIFAIYDRLIKAYAEKSRTVDDSTASDAKKYLTYLERHGERPLTAYYEKFGGDFLQWVRATARIGK